MTCKKSKILNIVNITEFGETGTVSQDEDFFCAIKKNTSPKYKITGENKQ